MHGILILLLLLVPQDKYQKAADGIKLPAEDVKDTWGAKSPQHAKVIKVLDDRDNWVRAFKEIEGKLGFWYDAPKIDVKFEEWEDTQAAYGGGVGGEGGIRFNMRVLSDYQKKIEDFEALKAQGPVKVYVPPTRIERTVWHELTHVYQDKLKAPDWFREGMATYVEQNVAHLRWFAYKDRKLATLDDPVESLDMYARGWLFFLWFEDSFGADKVKALADATCRKGKDYKEAIQEISKKPWATVVEEEKAWAAEKIKKLKKEMED